jgi:hypothetical protein
MLTPGKHLPKSGDAAIYRLQSIQNQYDEAASLEKLELLHDLSNVKVKASKALLSLHSALCFIRTFPDSTAHFRAAHSLLSGFEERVLALSRAKRAQLDDSGIAGTRLFYEFSYEVASWMARHFPDKVAFYWNDINESSRLEELLELMMLPSEGDYFDSGLVNCREWIELSSVASGVSDFRWFFSQFSSKKKSPGLAATYNAAELSLVWDLQDSKFSKSLNALPVRKIHERRDGMRKPTGSARSEILRPVENLQKLPSAAASRLLDVAMASLAARHRETNHFNYANTHEVYVADVGRGVTVAVFGLSNEHRFPLECTMGYLILSNGMPIGYGGGSALFKQINIGLNIFDEYRGSEAAFLWVQVMRVYHHLTGCTRFIANSYQFGSENMEALKSGAFWFYYRLGYRPVLASVRKQARAEWDRMRKDRSYRSSTKTLRALSSCDMHFTLLNVRASELFEERWIETSSLLATQELAATGCLNRTDAVEKVSAGVARDLGMRSVNSWSAKEKNGFQLIAPFVAAARPANWPSESKRSVRKILRAKGGEDEVEFARLVAKHDHFLSELRRRCRSAE